MNKKLILCTILGILITPATSVQAMNQYNNNNNNNQYNNNANQQNVDWLRNPQNFRRSVDDVFSAGNRIIQDNADIDATIQDITSLNSPNRIDEDPGIVSFLIYIVNYCSNPNIEDTGFDSNSIQELILYGKDGSTLPKLRNLLLFALDGFANENFDGHFVPDSHLERLKNSVQNGDNNMYLDKIYDFIINVLRSYGSFDDYYANIGN